MAFLARRKTIQAELDAGRSLAAIHAGHREALGIGYVQFTRYVRHYLRGSSDARPRPAAGADAAERVRRRPDKASSSIRQPSTGKSSSKALSGEGASSS